MTIKLKRTSEEVRTRARERVCEGEHFGFADIRTNDGVAASFHSERDVNGVKQEALKCTIDRRVTAAPSAPAVRQAGL